MKSIADYMKENGLMNERGVIPREFFQPIKKRNHIKVWEDDPEWKEINELQKEGKL